MLKRARYLLLIVAVSALVAGGWAAWQSLFTESPTVTFRERLRLPQYLPEWLNRTGGAIPNEAEVRAGVEVPYLVVRWERRRGVEERRRSVDPDLPRIGVILGLVDTELEMDLEGQERAPVEVDGVQGWLTKLGPDEFIEPEDRDEKFELWRGWFYDRAVYVQVMGARSSDAYGNGMLGPAIALQWNNKGIHYLLIAQDRDLMNASVLLQIANSMAPSEFPFPF